MINPIQFPEVTSNQINIALVADKLNELIADHNRRFPDPEPDNAFLQAIPPDFSGVLSAPHAAQLKPGVTITRNGRYSLAGKGLIKASEAFI